jgi:hypothetical protein
MTTMSSELPITLKEVQLRLGVPQHVLIHLCEKSVIEPDFAETSGRGKRREFSKRNLLEFAVALALRKLDLPVATAGLMIRVLRYFSSAMAKVVPGFDLPGSLLEDRVAFDLHLFDGDMMVLVGRAGGLKAPLQIGTRISGALHGSATKPRVLRLGNLPAAFDVCLTVNLVAIARRVLK